MYKVEIRGNFHETDIMGAIHSTPGASLIRGKYRWEKTPKIEEEEEYFSNEVEVEDDDDVRGIFLSNRKPKKMRKDKTDRRVMDLFLIGPRVDFSFLGLDTTFKEI